MATQHQTTAPAPTKSEEPDLKPFGPVAAVFFAAGIAAVVLGLLTTLAEASASISSWLEFSARVGALSGETIIEVAVFFLTWAVLYFALRDKDPAPRTVFVWTAILLAIGLVMTFPIFFKLFEPEA